jgi:hypothetical protein
MFLCSALSVFATMFQMILLTQHVKVGTIERPLSLLDRPIGFHRVSHVTILSTARASAQLSVLIQTTSLPWQSTSCLTRLRPLIGFTSTRTHLSRPRRCVNVILLNTVLFTHEGSLHSGGFHSTTSQGSLDHFFSRNVTVTSRPTLVCPRPGDNHNLKIRKAKNSLSRSDPLFLLRSD